MIDWLLGDRCRIAENMWSITVELSLFPDMLLGHRYIGKFTRQQETRWRSRFPWFKRRTLQWEISFSDPPRFAGKSEAEWDQGDDGIFRMWSYVEDLDDAIEEYKHKVYSRRVDYGMPSNLPQFPGLNLAEYLF